MLTEPQGSDGSIVFYTVSNSSPNGRNGHPIPYVHASNDTGLFVEALITKAPPRTTMLGTCALIQYSEYVRLWGEIQGMETKMEILSIEDAVRLWPGGFGIEVAETLCYIDEYGWDGGEGAILPVEAGVDKAALTNVRKYIETTDWSWVCNPSGQD